MQKFTETITASQGGTLVPLAGASVSVYNAGTLVLATLYADNAGSAQSNPVTSSATGLVAFYAPDGRYDIVATKAGFTPVTIGDVLFEDPADGVITNIEGAVIVDSTIDSTPIGATTPAAGSFTQVTLAPNGPTPPTLGQIKLNTAEETLDIGLGHGVVGHLFEDSYTTVVNDDTVTLAPGQVVKFAGVDADVPQVSRARADYQFNPMYLVGVVASSIPVNGTGKVLTVGHIHNIDTSAFAAGSILYLDPDTSGGLTTTEPQFPDVSVPVAAVITSDATAGSLWVRPLLHQRLGAGTFYRQSNSTIVQNTWTAFPVDYVMIPDASLMSIGLETTPPDYCVVVGKTGRYRIDFKYHVSSTTSSAAILRGSYFLNGSVVNAAITSNTVAGSLSASGTTLAGYHYTTLSAGDKLQFGLWASSSTLYTTTLFSGAYGMSMTVSQVV